ncbi:MAG: DUF2779 domain-containing protein [Candidatus Competibacter sp.]|nr:DUF2779 domain-containing protein [Candidatus Competibacter sp.]
MTHGLSKSRLQAFRQCPKRLWLTVHRPDWQEVSEETEQRFQIGFQVGDVARSLHPDGILIDTPDAAEALALTRKALVEHPDRPLFEAAFQRDGVLVRADLLLPEADGYRLREVKASTRVKDEHREDCAIQAWVIGAALPLTGVELAHVDTAFVYPGGGDYRGLLQSNLLDGDMAGLLPAVPQWIADARATLAGVEPAIAIGSQCHSPYECPFQSHCGAGQPPQPDYPLGCLPRLSGQRWQGLMDQGITDVRHIPTDYPLTAKQARVARVIRSGVAERDPVAATLLNGLAYPRYYLDFESLQVAVPLWVGTQPYQQLVVQWSCHVETAPGQLTQHAFLAEGGDDPRRAFAEALVETVGDAGPVFVYNRSFEVGRLRELAQSYPDLAPALAALIARVIDLKPLTERYYCHPAMKGSGSLKAVLPTIAPELDYGALAIGGGDAASGAWRELYHPDTSADRRAELRAALAEYCQRDTLALVRLATFLAGQP